MSVSELVTPQHLNRKAIVYIRQSNPHQMLSNQESLRLQYALRQRGVELGWHHDDIEIIDCDLGTTAAAADHREGFKELLAQVTLGEVGLLLSYDVTRLSRNCSDWYPLLDLCGYRGCLIADRDGVYDPSTTNGRLLLGLKGQISEMELHTIRARLTAGLLNKAERGELALPLPSGLERDSQGVVQKISNREVQDRITLVFETFIRLKSACKVVRYFNEQGLLIPRRDRFQEIVWRQPTTSIILSILKNPAYAGAFVYGRTRTVRTGPAPHQARRQKLPMEEWKIRVNDKYPAYISWETFEQIQAQIKDNYAEYDRNKSRGIPRPGTALLHGLTYCGKCGHKMLVQYKDSTHYICNHLRQQYLTPVCQFVPATTIDEPVVKAFFEALSSVELDAYSEAIATQEQAAQKLEQAHQQQLERLRYQAALAERQFNHVDPENRLVAVELERRWEQALRELRQAEQEQVQRQSAPPLAQLSPELKTAFTDLGQKLPQLWQDGVFTTVQKKSLLRCLIDKVVLHRIVRDRACIRIVWKGGDTTTVEVPIPVGSFAELSNAAELEERILTLSRQGIDDQTVAEQLTAEGFRSPLRLTVLPSTVKRIRLQHRILQLRRQSHPRQVPGFLTITQLAKALNLPTHWFYHRIRKGTLAVSKDEVRRLYLFPDQPSTLEQFEQFKVGKIHNLRF